MDEETRVTFAASLKRPRAESLSTHLSNGEPVHNENLGLDPDAMTSVMRRKVWNRCQWKDASGCHGKIRAREPGRKSRPTSSWSFYLLSTVSSLALSVRIPLTHWQRTTSRAECRLNGHGFSQKIIFKIFVTGGFSFQDRDQSRLKANYSLSSARVWRSTRYPVRLLCCYCNQLCKNLESKFLLE